MIKNESKLLGSKLLYDFGLYEKLNEYGKTHIIGSFKMDLMAWNDLDLYIENEAVSIKSIHEITKFILDHFSPIWFEGKQQITNGSTEFFIGFETEILGELWNFDIWFFDKTKISECVNYCNNIYKQIMNNVNLKDIIIKLKRDLISTGLYSSTFNSMDVYEAVLNQKLYSVDEMINKYKKP